VAYFINDPLIDIIKGKKFCQFNDLATTFSLSIFTFEKKIVYQMLFFIYLLLAKNVVSNVILFLSAWRR
jgi:hypothetical protein